MKKNERSLGVVLSYLGQVVQILTALIYTPVMLRLLGQSEYGLYQLVYSVVSYLSLLSLGFGASYMRFYFRYKASGDDKKEAQLNGMFLLIFVAISVICVICGILMVTNIHTLFGNGLTEAEYEKASVLMILMVVNLAMTFPNSVFNCIIMAHERFIFQKTVIMLQYLLNPLLALPLLLAGYGSVGMVVVTTALTAVVLVSNLFFCVNRIHAKFLFRGLEFGLLKEMWIFTFYIFLHQMIDQINWSVDKFLLGRMLDTTAVAVYGLAGQINSMYLMFSTALSGIFTPRVNEIVSTSDDNKELSLLFTRIGRLQYMVIGLILTGFIFFGRSFLYYWGGKGYEASYVVTLWLIVPVSVPLIQNLGIEIQRAKNLHKARSLVCLVIAVGNIFLSIPLIRALGPVGAAIGTAISLLLGNILFMNWYYRFRVGLDIGGFWRSIARLSAGLVIPCISGILMNRLIPVNRIFTLIVLVIFYVVIYCICMYFFGMDTQERQMLKGRLKRVAL